MSKCGLRAVAVAAVALAVAGWSPAAHAAGLFLPVADKEAAVAASALGGAPTPAVVWERRVRVLHQELAGVRADVQAGDTGRLLLNIRPGVALDVVVERTAPTKRGYSLSGRIEGGQIGFATLVVHEEAVAGTIWTPEAAYEVSSLGGGVHAIRDVTNAPRAECAGAVPTELSAAAATPQEGTDDGSVVDILVVWTPAEERNAGGEPQVLSRIDMLIAWANDAFERSGAYVSLNLVGAERVDYQEPAFSEGNTWSALYGSLNRLIDPDDGHMDGVHDRRNVLGADLVYLLARLPGGRGQVLGAFSVGVGDGMIFAHEVGHNLGLWHDRYEAGPVTFGHGFATDDALCERTIMTYPNWCEDRGLSPFRTVPFYSSPWRYSPVTGKPLGVPSYSSKRGPRGPADAVLAINRNRHTIANFRSSRDER